MTVTVTVTVTYDMAWHELKLFAYLMIAHTRFQFDFNEHTKFASISIVANYRTIVTIVSVATLTEFVTVTTMTG